MPNLVCSPSLHRGNGPCRETTARDDIISRALFECEAVWRGGTVQSNDTKAANERATYCTIHQLFLTKPLRLTSPSDDLVNQCSEIMPNLAQTWPSTHPDLRRFFAFFDVSERGFNLVL